MEKKFLLIMFTSKYFKVKLFKSDSDKDFDSNLHSNNSEKSKKNNSNSKTHSNHYICSNINKTLSQNS